MRDYQESVTTGQTHRQTPDKVIPMCRYASQAKQKSEVTIYNCRLTRRFHWNYKFYQHFVQGQLVKSTRVSKLCSAQWVLDIADFWQYKVLVDIFLPPLFIFSKEMKPKWFQELLQTMFWLEKNTIWLTDKVIKTRHYCDGNHHRGPAIAILCLG